MQGNNSEIRGIEENAPFWAKNDNWILYALCSIKSKIPENGMFGRKNCHLGENADLWVLVKMPYLGRNTEIWVLKPKMENLG